MHGFENSVKLQHQIRFVCIVQQHFYLTHDHSSDLLLGSHIMCFDFEPISIISLVSTFNMSYALV